MPQLEQVFAEQQQQNPGQNPQNQQQQNEENEGAASSWTGFFRQLMTTNPEVAGVVAAFESYIPFILILAIKQLFDYSTGMLYKSKDTFEYLKRAEFLMIPYKWDLKGIMIIIHFVKKDQKCSNLHQRLLNQLFWKKIKISSLRSPL